MKKMKTLLAGAFSVALAATMFVGCSSSAPETTEGTDAADNTPAATEAADEANEAEEATDETTDEITKIVVGFDAGYPPYGYVADDGSYTGFDLDLAQAVADKNGWEMVAEPIDWDAKDALVQSGAIDCIWNGFTMEGREKDYAFSDPYMLNEQVVVVRADSDIKTVDDLAGKTVMTQVDSAALDVLQGDQAELADTFKELSTIGDYNNAFMQLESGMVDAVACDLSIAAYQMAANPDVYTQLTSLSSEHYAVGFDKANTELAAQVTSTLITLNDEGVVEDLCEKYADQGISYDNWILK